MHSVQSMPAMENVFIADYVGGERDMSDVLKQLMSTLLGVWWFAEKKMSFWWKVLKWILIVLLAILVIGGILYCCFAFLRGTRALGESGRTLGWWPFGYFTRQQQAGVEPDPSPLLAETSESSQPWNPSYFAQYLAALSSPVMKEELELGMPFQTKSGLNDKLQEAYQNAAGLMLSIAKHHHE